MGEGGGIEGAGAAAAFNDQGAESSVIHGHMRGVGDGGGGSESWLWRTTVRRSGLGLMTAFGRFGGPQRGAQARRLEWIPRSGQCVLDVRGGAAASCFSAVPEKGEGSDRMGVGVQRAPGLELGGVAVVLGGSARRGISRRGAYGVCCTGLCSERVASIGK